MFVLVFVAPRWFVCGGSCYPGQLVHVCPAGCCGDGVCASRETSLDKAMVLVDTVILRGIQIPAVNKWTKVEPVIASITLMVSCFKLVLRALQSKLGVHCDDDGSDLSEDAQVGAPKDEMKTHRKLSTKRNAKTLQFFAEADTEWRLLVWMLVCMPIMSIHYRLFKFGTWFSHRTDDRCGAFDFCNPATNPDLKVLAVLSCMLCCPNGTGRCHWLPLMTKYGPSGSWPTNLIREAQATLIIAICSLWRRLVHPWACYPWLLARVVDPNIPLPDRQLAGKSFMEAKECCLDGHFG